MNITEQREAIYVAEREIEAALDKLRETARMNANDIKVQTLLDDGENEAPAIKVNIAISLLKP